MGSEAGALSEVGARVAESGSARLFGRNTVASFFAFAIDIALLWTLVEMVGLTYLPAAATAGLPSRTSDRPTRQRLARFIHREPRNSPQHFRRALNY